uniref:Uncharacterized protein TCIL3000_5_4590 n=1 Tax=Trypanosoma congolense (strain IL3000) TaxID=1068625 RepID=G0UM48_TRYCI|nr:unnamed protein product [Trypanosoma congolense IL3000]
MCNLTSMIASRSVGYIAILLLCKVIVVSGWQSFSPEVPQEPYDTAYRAYFHNYDSARHCILKGFLTQGGEVTSTSSEYWGCAREGGRVSAHSLLLVKAMEVQHLKEQGCRPGELVLLLQGMLPPQALTTEGIGITLSADGGFAVEYDLRCLLDTVQRYNELQPLGRGGLPAVTAVFFSNDTVDCSSCRSWCEDEDPLLVPCDVRSLYGFEIVYVPKVRPAAHGNGTTEVVGEWESLVQTANFNRVRWTKGAPLPHNVVEMRSGAELVPRTNSETSFADCLNETSSPVCSPLGGWTVWATNADTKWEWQSGGDPSFVKKTRKGAIAIMVPSTTLSLVHGAAPGADCPASGIVTALAVMGTLREFLKSEGENSRDVYAFFFPGEHVGSIGSSRFVADVTQLECAKGGVEACRALAYADDLNFTTVDINAIETFLVIDQVAMDGAPLFYHVDSRVDPASVSPQGRAEALLSALGVQRASTKKLPYSPITTVVDLLGNSTLVNKTLITLTRYNLTYANPNVFTVRDFASQDGGGTVLSANSVAEAAEVVLRVLLPGAAVTVNRTVVRTLWDCFTANINCDFVAPYKTPRSPDYSVGVMGGYVGGGYTPTQKAIEVSLRRLGWGNVVLSPAVSVAVRVPDGDWTSAWQVDERWLRQEVYRDARYALYVVSEPRMAFGARGAMIGSHTAPVALFFLSIVVCVMSFLYVRWCIMTD